MHDRSVTGAVGIRSKVISCVPERFIRFCRVRDCERSALNDMCKRRRSGGIPYRACCGDICGE